MVEEKKDFLQYELGILTLNASLATRTSLHPVYAQGITTKQSSMVRRAIRQQLVELQALYVKGGQSEADHIAVISHLANQISQSHQAWLHQGRFRFGVAQKLINLYLKYLWCAELIAEPPHCPIDGIIRDLANLDYYWISNDSAQDYINAISQLKIIAAPNSLALWELQEFRRPEQNPPIS
ncbi:hypothetical protein [Shewanella waksmanii]|uniref:hypothetical protein n=1 Tax=Shewanella waksmanii TaxID=213783 RepID=UPI003735AF09